MEDLIDREHFLEMLTGLTRTILTLTDYQSMLQALADQLGDLFQADGCYITRWDAKEQRALPGAAYGPLRDIYHQLTPNASEPTLTHHVLKTGRSLAIEDVQESPHLSSHLAHLFPTRSLLGLPLIAADQQLGAILIAYNHQHHFTQTEIARGEMVAAQFAFTLVKVHLLLQEREQRELAETLRDVTALNTNTLTLDDLLDRILVQLRRIVAYDSASIMLTEGDVLHSVAQRSIYIGGQKGRKIRLNEFPHIQAVFDTHTPVIISQTSQSPNWHPISHTNNIRCWMGIPIIIQDQVVGLINLSTSQANYYEQRHAHLAVSLANQAAISIENVRLYTRLQEYANELESRVQQRTHELQLAYERLQELDQLKSKLIDDISHELRTPVTNLLLYLDLWERGEPDRRLYYQDILKQQANRLAQLVENIIQLSQLDLMKRSIHFTHQDLSQIVELIVQTQRPRAEALGLKLQFTPQPHLPPILGDARLLLEMLNHLLENALTYTHQGEVSLRVEMAKEGDAIYLSVQDTGAGIAVEDMPHLFSPLYRGQGVGQSARPGVGLGLAVVSEIVTLHGGQIEVESLVNKGSLFRVRIPCATHVESAV